MPIRHRYAITDSFGGVAEIRITISTNFQSWLRHIYRSDGFPGISNEGGSWRALTYGAFAAQFGSIAPERNTGDANFYHLFLRATIRGGRLQDLMILKNWFAGHELGNIGTGTLHNGVNLGLRPGECNWARMD